MKWNKLRSKIPRNVIPFIALFYRPYINLLIRIASVHDRKDIEKSGFRILPSVSLRYRVGGDLRLNGFLKSGREVAQNIRVALKGINRNIEEFKDILDFGCGCGRTLLWFAPGSDDSRFYGTDIDPEAIFWCRRHLTFATFSLNGALPPLEYSDETFDLIYAISVFTHLDEDYQFQWLEELRRIAKTGSVALISVIGRHRWQHLHRHDLDEIERRGFAYIRTYQMKGILPDWYQMAYHTEEYVRRNYSRYFEILDYIPRGIANYQDLVIVRKKV
jgi:SAM-dependent methyltransferase